MKTAIILAVSLALVSARPQDFHSRGRPFQSPNQAFQRQLPTAPTQHQQQQQQQQQQQFEEETSDNSPQQQPQQQEYHERSHQSGISERRTTTTPIPIIQWNKQQEHDGTYRTSYETGNNILAEEQGYIKTIKTGEGEYDTQDALVQQGSYSYNAPDGTLITVRYIADETGFHATGDHIPTAPPVSEEIQKGLDLIYEGIRQQQEAAAREEALKSNQPLAIQRSQN